MGVPFPVMQQYLGFMSDLPRHELPPGMCWDLVNFIPELDGSLRRRNGFASLGMQDFSAMNASAIATGAFVGYCPFATVAHEALAINGQGYAFSFQEPSFTGSFVSLLPAQVNTRPVFHRDQMVLAHQGMETRFYTGRVGGFVAGTGTPKGHFLTLWGDYTVQGNDEVSNRSRIWFSAAGDPRTYDLTSSWLDIPGVVKGLEGSRGVLLVWSDHELWRITGTTPPSSGIVGDLTLKHFADVGLADERSIAVYGGWVIWANAEGVWMTDGSSAPRNLTVEGGINNFWRTTMKGYTLSSTDYIIAGGIYRGYYMLAVTSLNDSVMVMLACDLATNRWFRISAPWMPSMFAHAVSGHEDSFWVSSLNLRVISTASAWETSSNLEYDGSGVYGNLETPLFRGFQRFHRKWIPSDATSVWRRLYLNYEAGQYLTNPALRVGYTTSPDLGAAYTTLGSLPALAPMGRGRMAVNPNGGAVSARGIGFRFDQLSGTASTDLRINDLELEYFTREGSR